MGFGVLLVFIGMCNSESPPTLPETPLEASGRYDNTEEVEMSSEYTLYTRSSIELFTWEQAFERGLAEEGGRTYRRFSDEYAGIVTLQTAASESSIPSEDDVSNEERTRGVFKLGEQTEEGPRVIWRWVEGPTEGEKSKNNLFAIRNEELGLVRILHNNELRAYLLRERFAE
jgi:hypothetical protein